MNKQTVYVWDIGVRLFHWSLVPLFFISYITGEGSEGLHANVSYIILGLIIFRVIWGFIGSKYARFSNFIYSPAKVIKYIKSFLTGKPIHYIGHNPVGGWMVIILLTFIFLSCWTGLVSYGKEGHGPLAQDGLTVIDTAEANDDEDDGGKSKGDELWEEIHEAFSNITLLLVLIHIAGVIISGRIHKEKLVRAMITGYKEVPDNAIR